MTTANAPIHEIGTAVVGAGVVGLAAAYKLALSGRDVIVFERAKLVGSQTSSRNSEVIHAGIYYPPGSLKSRLCLTGKAELYRFCADHGVDHKACGKLIVATSPQQAGELGRIAATARAAGLDDLVLITGEEARAMEPELHAVAALNSPSTGILDSHGYMLALEGAIADKGGQIVLDTELTGFCRHPGGGFVLRLGTADGETTLTCRELVLSAGLWASKLSAAFDWPDGYVPPQTWYAKGNYFALAGRAPFQRLIYPVPEPGGLGVHITKDLAGRARFGPDVEWIEQPHYDVDPRRADGFYAAIRNYWPGLPDGALQPDYAGIRPKIVPAGAAAADFAIHGPDSHGVQGLVALYGIESPGLTASLAIGGTVALLLR